MISLLGLAVLLVLALTALPLYVLVVTSFRPRGSYGFDSSPLTLANYADLASQRAVLERFINAEDDRILAGMEPNSAEGDAYFKKPVTP